MRISQQQGWVGRMVGSMVRRSVRKRFHTVYWRNNSAYLSAPAILYANHHGWMDGYLMFHLIDRLQLTSVDWIEEFDSFPLFSKIGGLRFAKGDTVGRASTIRKTIRLMKQESCSLVIFPEGVMHRPPAILPFGRAIEFIAKCVPNVVLAPVAIHYELSLHERPEAWLWIGEGHTFESLRNCESRSREQLDNLRSAIQSSEDFEVLARGTSDVNERFDMRRIP